ncbi:MAG: sugar kinase [Bacteroidales bacterium]|nr:sugar kinase [Bacteroidales bacterium]
MDNKVVTFGEILLRLTPPGHLKISQSKMLCASFGGSETNVAVSLAHLGIKSEFVTRLPQNDVAEACLMDLRSHSVGTEHIVFGGDRLGLYYFENTAAMRVANVVYDRGNSSFCTTQRGMIDWRRVFNGATWFHWSGIAPSVSASAADVTMEAVDIAHDMGLTISSDLNFRKNLWTYGKRAEEVMPALARKCDVLFGTEGEYQKAFGIEPVAYDAQSASDKIDLAAHEDFCRRVMAQTQQCKFMFVALRNVLSANHHILTGLLYTRDGQMYTTRTYDIDHIVDCVGVGDAFAAGIIYGLLNYNGQPQKALNFAVAASALKNTFEGDYSLAKPQDVLNLAVEREAGNVSR